MPGEVIGNLSGSCPDNSGSSPLLVIVIGHIFQLVEKSTHNGEAVGSSPSMPILLKLSNEVIGNLLGSCPENSGSNPLSARYFSSIKIREKWLSGLRYRA